MDNYSPGSQCPVKFQPFGGVQTTLNVKGWNFDEESVLADVSNTSHQGRTARIACKADHKGSVSASLDLDQLPFAAPVSIRAGTRGVLLFYLSPLKPVQVPVVVSKLHHEMALEKEVSYSFDVQENVLAGNIVYPAT